jgi:hypothetical protein
MRRYSTVLAMALASGLTVAQTREAEDAEREAEEAKRETYKPPEPRVAAHTQSREAARRRRQMARIEAKRNGDRA